MAILGALLVLGLCVKQIQRLRAKDTSPVSIIGAVRIDGSALDEYKLGDEASESSADRREQPAAAGTVTGFEADVVDSTPGGKAGSGATGDSGDEMPAGGSFDETLVDLNLATIEQLETLPGIGPRLAQRIIDYRTKYGPFQRKKDILLINGIGEKRFATLEPLTTTTLFEKREASNAR